MYTVKLECEQSHAFEGWYDSAKDYEERLNTLSCPVCDSEFVMRKSSAQSKVGKHLMSLAREIKHERAQGQDRAGSQYFKVLLD
ncbi:MAG: DUF1178 family protein [Deltaproteobacteria bacterium]|nr:DUF1178 family protein [Deltaproteobacteria bacterium]